MDYNWYRVASALGGDLLVEVAGALNWQSKLKNFGSQTCCQGLDCQFATNGHGPCDVDPANTPLQTYRPRVPL